MTTSDQLFAYAREQHFRAARAAIYKELRRQADTGEVYVGKLGEFVFPGNPSDTATVIDGDVDLDAVAWAAVEAVRPSR